MYRIMTVCTGNICRSPVGEYLIHQHAQEAGVPVTVTSSGISNEEEGNRIDPRAAAQLTTRGIDPSAHRASVFTVEDFDRNDLILAMDAPHYLRLKALARNDEDKAKIRMMRSFDPKVTTTHLDQLGIYDPWYGSERDFVYTTDLIDAAARASSTTSSRKATRSESAYSPEPEPPRHRHHRNPGTLQRHAAPGARHRQRL
jgi:hypothetical protein